MALLRTMLVAVLALMPVAAGGQVDDFAPYRALVGKQCPDKHLEWLSPIALDALIEVRFHDTLPPALQTKLDAADKTEKASCANATGGIVCFNAAYMRAMNDVSLLPRFAKLACTSGLSCQGQSNCTKE